MDDDTNAAAPDLSTEEDRTYKLMHKLRAQILETLSVLEPIERAAVIYTLGIEPGIREHMPAVMFESVQSVLRAERSDRAQTCQCPSCMAKRAQA